MIIDMSLKNSVLYAGCEIESVAGRLNLITPIKDAIEIIGKNVFELLETIPRAERTSITLTGPMAVWAYMIVFHAVVHVFTEVRYNDGRSDDIVIARHGQSFQ